VPFSTEWPAARRIAICCSDPARTTDALLSVLGSGATAIPIDPRLHPEEIERVLRHASADLILADALDPRVRPPCPIERRLPTAGGLPADDSTLILHTSGSTSKPKAVVLDGRALLANATAWNARYGLTGDDVVLSALSPVHSFGITIGAIATHLANAKLVFADHPSPSRLARLARSVRPTIVLAVSATFAQLARSSSATRADFESARAFIGGASPLPASFIDALRTKLEHEVLLTYGLTEAGPVVTANPPGANRTGTVGTALDGVELRLEDDGELSVRSPSLMRGYLGEPPHDGWLPTGDLAAIDDGYVRILGRKKDLIIRGGEKIFPREIEEVLLAHPSILDAAVVGLSNDGVDEVPCACVVLQPGTAIEHVDLASHCARHLASFKVPRVFRAFAELPRNSNGKLLRAALAKAVADVVPPKP
jgi:long-chain acyl-CoA synthetase